MKFPRKLLFFPPLVLGILLMVFMVNKKQGPSRPEIEETSRTVNVINAKAMTVVPRITGYGYVQPTENWEGIPEVGGKIIAMHPELKKGSFIAKGEVLIRIDPQSYGLAESRSLASISSVEAQLKELEQQKNNTQQLLAIEEQKLQLSEQELERKKTLRAKGYISESELEQEKKNLLAQQASVDNLANSLKLIPSQQKALQAQKESDVSSLSERRLDIEKTVIRAPFHCRISAVNVELNQFTPAGATVVKAVNISAVEIPVQLSPTDFANLLSPSIGNDSPLSGGNLDMDTIRELIGISAIVRVPLFNKQAEWPGKFMRTSESIDLATGAITVFVAVDQPYEKIIPSERPPLVPNLYAEVELLGTPREKRYVVPFQAIHDDAVHLVDDDSRLVKRSVQVEMIMQDLAIISGGIEDGMAIITTDIVPAIEGMLLKPQIDTSLASRIDALDSGE